MKIGFVTRYTRHEAAYVALRLADWFSRRGCEISVLTPTSDPKSVDPRWDDRVVPASKRRYTDWIEREKPERLFFTHVPTAEQLQWTRRRSVPTYVVPLWHELGPNHAACMREATRVVALSQTVGDFLKQQARLTNVFVLPWDTGDPLYRKPEEHALDEPKFLLPVWDGIANRMHNKAIDLLGLAAARNRKVRFTIAYSSSTMASYAKRKCDELKRRFPKRFEIRKGCCAAERPALFQEHDLTIWPTLFESTCMLGLASVSAGTPVIAFPAPPIREFFDERNSVIVDAPLSDEPAYAVPTIEPDYLDMDDAVSHLLSDLDYLRALQQSVLQGLLERRTKFNTVLSALLK